MTLTNYNPHTGGWAYLLMLSERVIVTNDRKFIFNDVKRNCITTFFTIPSRTDFINPHIMWRTKTITHILLMIDCLQTHEKHYIRKYKCVGGKYKTKCGKWQTTHTNFTKSQQQFYLSLFFFKLTHTRTQSHKLYLKAKFRLEYAYMNLQNRERTLASHIFYETLVLILLAQQLQNKKIEQCS